MHLDDVIEAFIREHGVDRHSVDALLREVMAPGPVEQTWLELPDLTEHGLEDAPTEEVPLAGPDGQPVRYVELGMLGRGGMGEVVRVLDRVLRRTVAMKVLRERLARRPEAVSRFLSEAQATSQLEHPGIVPIYDLGRLPDGRPFFTMKEVRGRTLAAQIREKAPLRRLLEGFRVACEAVAYAHSRGLVHRDIKPDNVLVGEFGEVLVVDWGLASQVGEAFYEGGTSSHDTVSTASSLDPTWGLAGTPAYMPPELAQGDGEVGTSSDVYALGATLYHLLTGERPYSGRRAIHVLAKVLAGPPPPPRGPHIDEELSELCERAMAREPEARPDARTLAAAVTGWLEGSRRRARAGERVAEADRFAAEARARRARAEELDRRAAELLAALPTYAPEERKHDGWALQDEARSLRARAEDLDGRTVHRLRLALNDVPDLTEAHDRLARWFQARHAVAEREGRHADAAQLLALLGDHDRGEWADYREGHGALTLHTDPPGAQVTLYRLAERHRRLVPEAPRDLGVTPLDAVPLPMGSYLLELRAPGRTPVRYPVSITRQEHWHGIPPGADTCHPVALPPAGSLADDDCYVPAGYLHAGGDPDALNGLPYQRVWVDGFVMKRDPVTVGEYLVFLDDLVARGREADALRWAPRQRSGAGGVGPLLIGRDDAGRFVLVPDGEGDVWDPRWPIMMVDWYGAVAYADWLAERTGLPWRLPVELEWAHAARGGDGRAYVWGDFAEPSWCANLAAFEGRALPAPVGTFPIDTSVYGVRGLAGNVRDWLWDPAGGPVVADGRALVPADVDRDSVELRPRRGGAWLSSTRLSRIGHRENLDPRDRNYGHGFRLARSHP